MANRCIWCRCVSQVAPREHIVPESVGGPADFVLPEGVVCGPCNHALARLDKALSDEFDFMAFGAGVPRKDGKPPAIKSRGNFVATQRGGKPELSINMDPVPYKAHDGTVLGAFGKSKRNIDVSVERDGPLVHMSFAIPFGQTPLFVRAITKIAFSAFAHFLGAELALAAMFDPVRTFVAKGLGTRPLLMRDPGDEMYAIQVRAPYIWRDRSYVMFLRIGLIDFFVDLSPGMSALPELELRVKEIYGGKGVWVLPTRE